MNLTRFQASSGPRWALDQFFLPQSFTLSMLLDLPAQHIPDVLAAVVTDEPAAGQILAPVEPAQEIWASGVTYLRSREARQAESTTGDIYQRVYEAPRPELFFKASGWRAAGPDQPVRIRRDSAWNVPEPELVLVLNRAGEICGFTAGNDVSSRSIEGENPLYLPQAKVYNGSCALGPSIQLGGALEAAGAIPIRLTIERAGALVYEGLTNTVQMKRSFQELAGCLFAELAFPSGAFLMTGTGIVPPETFSLQPGDLTTVEVGGLVLRNITEA